LYHPKLNNRKCEGLNSILSLLPFFILSALLAWGNYLLAVKSGRSGVLWVLLTIIPVVGFLVTWYLIYSCIIRLLDRQRESAAWRMFRRSMPSGLTRGWNPVRRQEHAPKVNLRRRVARRCRAAGCGLRSDQPLTPNAS
jgi:hypothetical protein